MCPMEIDSAEIVGLNQVHGTKSDSKQFCYVIVSPAIDQSPPKSNTA